MDWFQPAAATAVKVASDRSWLDFPQQATTERALPNRFF